MQDINLIRKLAWSFHKSTGLDLDDLIQEATVAYFDRLKYYDESKGKLSTFMWIHIRNQLSTYVKREKEFQHPLVADVTELKGNLIPNVSQAPYWEGLTNDAQIVARIVLDSSRPYCKSRVTAKKRIHNILRNRGWDVEKITLALSDLKQAFT
jgi:DNA-directed RNA polymerase specialized sigma24 family protein